MELKLGMHRMMQYQYGYNLNDISYQVAVPQEGRGELRYQPKYRDNRQRQGEGDKQGHAMMGIELVDNHDSINIAEGDEAQREDSQGMVTLGKNSRIVGSEET